MNDISQRRTSWKRTGYGVGGLVALSILFLAIVMLSNAGLRGMRLDLTQNKLYTLTPGTRQVLGELKDPVNLYFYFSREAAAKESPLILPYATRVREFLEEIAARSGGNVKLRVIDPQPFSEDEDRAAEFGLQLIGPKDGEGRRMHDLSATPHEGEFRADRFDRVIDEWLPLTYALNAISRSMGALDLYPFVLGAEVERKLEFVGGLISAGFGAPLAATVAEATGGGNFVPAPIPAISLIFN